MLQRISQLEIYPTMFRVQSIPEFEENKGEKTHNEAPNKLPIIVARKSEGYATIFRLDLRNIIMISNWPILIGKAIPFWL